MSDKDHTTRETYFHPDDPAGWLKPDEPFMVEGLDWSWAFVWYKDVPHCPGYCVGSNGTAWSKIKRIGRGTGHGTAIIIGESWKRLKTPVIDKYQRVCLGTGEQRDNRGLHLFILETFIGPRPPGMDGLHWDDDRTNNRLSNLRWGTPLDNHRDAVRNGSKGPGELNGRAKVTEADVVAIREAYASGEKIQAELAEKYGVVQVQISAIVTGKTWSHVGGPITKVYRRCKITPQIADEMRDLAAGGMTREELADKFGVHPKTIGKHLRSLSACQ